MNGSMTMYKVPLINLGWLIKDQANWHKKTKQKHILTGMFILHMK
jgi:hypothetical protein